MEIDPRGLPFGAGHHRGARRGPGRGQRVTAGRPFTGLRREIHLRVVLAPVEVICAIARIPARTAGVFVMRRGMP
jgi:hypothetical protein